MKALLSIIALLLCMTGFGQTKYITLTGSQIQQLTPIVQQYDSLMAFRHVAVVPIMIRDSTYVLPTRMLSDPAFSEVLNAINAAGFRLYTVAVPDSMFIKFKMQ
jgi:hypothetical protein